MYFGLKTKLAVIRFQERFLVDGVVNAVTLKALKEATAKLSGDS